AGLLIALFGVRLLNRLLYGVDPLDPVVFATNLIAVAGVALIAAGIPALRAARISPAGALR
ncbi:MAG: hypothetical protein KDI48_19260, partial [Xanthomonadales bacterium]|nr:hypothetical protein [Xanthomonadales bacterium]